MISPVLRAGVAGIQKGTQELNVAAGNIVKITTPGSGSSAGFSDLTTQIVNVNLYEKQVAASVKVIKVADQNLGSLLDVTS